MRNLLKSLNIIIPALAVVVLFVSCASLTVAEETSGLVVLTGLPEEYNGRYLTLANGWVGDDSGFIAVDSFEASGKRAVAGVIENGAVTLKAWQVTATGKNNALGANYIGDGPVEFNFLLGNKKVISLNTPARTEFLFTVNFIGGRAAYHFDYSAEPETRGSLTITNLPEKYNGQYITAAMDFNSDIYLFAADSFIRGEATAGVIRNGEVTLKVWQRKTLIEVFEYSGNDSIVFNLLTLSSGRKFVPWNSRYDGSLLPGIVADFTDGKAVASYR